MSDIVLSVKDIFPHSRLLEFLNRGIIEAADTANSVIHFFRGKTYEEWFEYFEAIDFKPTLREAPIMAKVLLAFYQGMVLQAQDAAKVWMTLSAEEREQYVKTALDFAQRERTTWTLGERIECAFGSLLVFHNFFRDLAVQDKLLDRFVAIVFEAVVKEKAGVEVSQEITWEEQEKFYDMLLNDIDEDLSQDYSEEEIETMKRVQRRLYNNE